MKFREREPEKIEAQMAPMIDVVFQLLIFFMLTLKIVKEEGDFSINMPIGQSSEESLDEIPVDLKVRLTANADGSLANVAFGNNALGNGPDVYDRLNRQIIGTLGPPGSSFNDDVEVTIDADYNLHYNNVIQAVSAATGRVDPASGRPVRYVEKIKFAPPRRPEG